MTNKERVIAALQGNPVDRMPVTSLYNMLYHQDHFSELTGLPQYRLREWLSSSPEHFIEIFSTIHQQVPFELLQPHSGAPSRAWREQQEFVEKDGGFYRHDRQTDDWERLDVATSSGHATDYHAEEERHVFSIDDVNERVQATSAEQQVAAGRNDYITAVVERFGPSEFILSGGVIGIPYSCGWHVGLTNVFSMMLEETDLLDYLSKKILEQNIESIRCLAAAGGDAIYIDDATATCDMISVKHYERFSLPYMQEMVREIHRLGQKAILIYFGGIADRLEQIASIGADGLLMEATMKGFVNDVDTTVQTIGNRTTVFANIDPVEIMQNGTDGTLAAEIQRQVTAGRKGRGFIISTASPITPSTPLSRVQRFIELSKEYSRY